MGIKKSHNIILVLLAFAAIQSCIPKNSLSVLKVEIIAPADTSLFRIVQEQTFQYFWDGAEPVSGLARERFHVDGNYPENDKNIVTSGGAGFGVMAILVGMERNFITKEAGKKHLEKIVRFLETADRFHGAWPHWWNGENGKVKPFSKYDDGGDLVETSLLLQGLITARQYFSTTDAIETDLRTKINIIWNGVEWNWYRQNNQSVLYWHWSIDKGWIINQKISGWNEGLIVYALAASAPAVANRIPAIVYTNGWSRNGAMVNNNTYFGFQLPLGPNLGGPLFLSQYSFLGINPNGLNDLYADYRKQATNHTKINYEYCKANPKSKASDRM